MPKKPKPSPDQRSLFDGGDSHQEAASYGEKTKRGKKEYVKREPVTKMELSPISDDTFNQCMLFKSSLPLKEKLSEAEKKRGAPPRKMIEMKYDGGVIQAFCYAFPSPDESHIKALREIVREHGANISKRHTTYIDMRLLTKYVLEFT